MKKSQIFGLLTLLAVVGPASLLAEVYVPFASNRSIGGTVYKTKVWVTNIGTAQRTFTNAFMSTGANGSSLTGTGFGTNVAPGATVLLGTLAANGQYGMLEVAGAPQLVVNARIDAVAQSGAILSSANIPAVSTANAWKAGSVAQIQGVDRIPGSKTSDFGLINLSRDPAQCTIKAFRADGAQIANTATVTVLPVSQRHFEDALNLLGAPNITDVRFEASCNKQFYAYALSFRGSEIVVTTPSQTTDAVLIPSVAPGVVVSRPGTFFTAKDGASTIVVEIPALPNVRYAKATVDFDVSVGRFPKIPGGGLGFFSSVYSFRRNDRTLFHGLIIRNELGRATLDLGVTDDIALGKRDAWQEHTTYHVTFVHDTDARTISYKLSKNGQVVDELTPHANHLDLIAPTGKTLYVDFGASGIADGAYFPPIGWSYANLQIVLTPAATP